MSGAAGRVGRAGGQGSAEGVLIERSRPEAPGQAWGQHSLAEAGAWHRGAGSSLSLPQPSWPTGNLAVGQHRTEQMPTDDPNPTQWMHHVAFSSSLCSFICQKSWHKPSTPIPLPMPENHSRQLRRQEALMGRVRQGGRPLRSPGGGGPPPGQAGRTGPDAWSRL